MEKCYNATITGDVQDVGFRSLIENAARLYGLSGVVFNADDGSVRVICGGDDRSIEGFFGAVKSRGEQTNVHMGDIIRQEILVGNIGIKDLPYPFSRVLTDEGIDLARKLDKGIELLVDIRKDTSVLPEIKNGIEQLNNKFDSLNTKFDSLNTKFDSLNTKFDSLNTKFDVFIQAQGEHNKSMDEHNQNLLKILEKLSEK